MAVVNDSNLRDDHFSSLIISLENEEEILLIADGLKSCMKYYKTFNINELNERFLGWLLPFIKQFLGKVFQENCNYLDSMEEECTVIIYKQHLKIAAEIMEIVDTILSHLCTEYKLTIINISCLPGYIIEIISDGIDHCNKSTASYKIIFRDELLEFFKVIQKVHFSFLYLMDFTYIEEGASVCNEKSALMKQVLEDLCNLNKALFKINLRSWAANWKGYLNILSKYFVYVKESFDINVPITVAISEIFWIMNDIPKQIAVDLAKVTQWVKSVGFQIKAILRILDMFWSNMSNNFNLVLSLCLTVYNFPSEHFLSLKLPNIAVLVRSEVYPAIEPIIQKIIIDGGDLLRNITNYKSEYEKNPASSIYFINTLLRIICENGEVTTLQLDQITLLVFEYFKTWVFECFWDTETRVIFDELVLNLSVAIIIHPYYYTDVESTFLENVLGDNVTCALLAMDTWTLILSYCPSHFCLQVLVKLAKLERALDFGINTYRPEHVQFKCLINRIYDILPINERNELLKIFPPSTTATLWIVVGLDKLPVKELPIFYKVALNNIRTFGTEYFTGNNLKTVATLFDLLATLNFSEVNFDVKALSQAVFSLWGHINNEWFKNNVFKFFVRKLCTITGALIEEYDFNQMLIILDKMKSFTTEDKFKMTLCDLIENLSYRNFDDFGENSGKIDLLVADIIESLYKTCNIHDKLFIFRLLRTLLNNNKECIVYITVKRFNKEDRSEIKRKYLMTEHIYYSFSRPCLKKSIYLQYEHECVQWRDIACTKSKHKKLKQTEDDSTNWLDNSIQVAMDKWEGESSSSGVQPEPTTSKSSANMSTDEDDNDYDGHDPIVEVVRNLKENLKCLKNILKTEKLSRKNCSDLKQIACHLYNSARD